MHEQTLHNLDYYDRLSPGQADYWRYMPAPRLRTRTIIDILRREQPSSVIDLGCGDGTLLAEIRSALPHAFLAGVDLSPAQIEANRTRMPDLQWHVGDIESASLHPGRTFAALTSSEVIEHLVNPDRFLRAARTVADDGAVLVLSTQSGRIGETEKHVGHLRHFSKEDITALLQATGWQPERVWNAGFPFHDLSKWAANRSAKAVIRNFGDKRWGISQRFVAAVLRFLFRFNSDRRGAQLFAVARHSSS